MIAYYKKLEFIIFPVVRGEKIKFFSIASLMFFILFNQNLIRNLKDSFVVTLIGTEIISFIKLWGEFPVGILFVVVYTKLCNVMSTEKIFRVVVVFFISFFTIFAFLIYPYYSYLHLKEDTILYYVSLFPYLKWFIVMVGHWGCVTFYIMGELWPMVVFSLMFWQLINKITSVNESKRFYFLFSIFGQSNLLLSGQVISWIIKHKKFLSQIFFPMSVDTDNIVLLKIITILVIVSATICLILHKVIDVIYVKQLNQMHNVKIDVLALNFKESTKMIFNSKYLLMIFILVATYSVSVNLIEGVWMSRTKALYPNTADFMNYQAKVLFWTGIMTLVFSIFGGVVVRKIGWFFAALATPLMITTVGAFFLIGVILETHITSIFVTVFAIQPIILIVIAGAIQNILGKSTKYSFFDASKEMLYIPLDKELKAKGKAAVDIMGGKVGKFCGAGVQFITFTLFPTATHEGISPILLSVFLLNAILWVYAVCSISKQYQLRLSDALKKNPA
ncbi:ADP/ATP carrier protein [Rickettsia endosymbiont of Cardiosporidium cionae]|nr:ADP/ATP carrier protein [Rickettsia endosymbiont of Cardiosporidium cionae]